MDVVPMFDVNRPPRRRRRTNMRQFFASALLAFAVLVTASLIAEDLGAPSWIQYVAPVVLVPAALLIVDPWSPLRRWMRRRRAPRRSQ
jgi:O-antigen/teichoic acid export membrane protein